ncbi:MULTISPECIES: aldo/keto reductase [unclassified Pseudomonas]|uniref:aldo/keto reductase n=1 Tax=unclassified Pseudomonas TaxID=196821 RepID=UPI002AC90243|nr:MULTISPECIES: aldo/keto reductase [unclassified Pseudomonas]MEB0039889.1 aldo/keto reductase [Pseudomonas sp. MH10]MEB0120627.1 aldo/keto reductase [Pseudomonas sp. CCI1.2]WPX64626.1 aldo/keto reductase [Pseudomonas sp. MH10]
MSQAPLITLNDGVQIPQLGLGVWQLTDEQAFDSSTAALAAGYRHIDTAMIYGNEAGVGRAVAESDVPREDIFITTKLWNADHGFDKTLRAYDASLKLLGLEKVDLYLIHWPLPAKNAYAASWRALVQLQKEGRIRSIGVSNFNADHLERIIGDTGVKPSVNQIEIHPDFVQQELLQFCQSQGIDTESWSPLGQGGELLNQPVLKGIAAGHGRTAAQVILRWHLQTGRIVIPRSSNPGRIVQNFSVFDFELSAQDMAAIASIEQAKRLGPDPATFNLGA